MEIPMNNDFDVIDRAGRRFARRALRRRARGRQIVAAKQAVGAAS